MSDHRRRPGLGWLALAICLPPAFAHADSAASDSTPSDSAPVATASDAATVRPVDVTRLPAVALDTPDLEVITRADIDARQAVYAADILDTVPGLAVTSDGAFGGVTSIRIRGASSDKTLVLIDGIPQNDPSDPNGAYDFSSLDLSDFSRIEILEGPQSSLWGSDAIGGVISLTTRELNGWRAQAEGGSLDRFEGSAAYGQRTNQWAYGFSVFGDRTNGVPKADGTGVPNPYSSWSAGGYGRYEPADWLSVDARLRYQQSYASVDGYNATTGVFGYTPQYARSQSWTGSARAIAQAPFGFTDTLTVGVFNIDRSDTYIGSPANSSAYWGRTWDYRFTAERGAPTDPWGLDFGVERQTTDASLSNGARLGLGATSGFVVGRVSPLTFLTLTASERYDATDTYGSAATGHVSAVVKLPAGFSVEGAWGQGFKTPTISEIACDFCYPVGPSYGLKPEHAVGWDGTLAWTSAHGLMTAKLTGYELAVRDQIEYAPTYPYRYVNIDNTRTDGLEAEADIRLTRQLKVEAEYAYTNAVDLASGMQLLRVPRDAGSATLDWTRGPWQAAFTLRVEGPDLDENPTTFVDQVRPGFVLANIAGSYALTPKLALTARVDDIANTHYQEVLGYGEPGLMVFFGIRAKG